MKRFIVLAPLLTIFLTAPVSAISNEQRGSISQNCNAIKTSLKALQKSDSKTRVILGTSYQAILTNFLTPLNIRLVKVNLSDASLSTTQANIASEWATFQDQFIKYSQSLESLINIDCKSNPDGFYEKLEATRSSRKTLNKTALKINKLITSSVNTVADLKNSLTPEKDTENNLENNPEKESEDGSL